MDASAPRTATRRTFLVDRRFQLRYTGIMVSVGIVITMMFGALMYRAHLEAVQLIGSAGSFEGVALSRADDRLIYTVVAVTLLMSCFLTVFGVLITHRIAGPVYIIGRYLQTLGEGQYPTLRPLRHGDELKAFFGIFQEAVDQIRSRDSSDAATLDAALGQLEGFCARTPDAAGALGATLVSLKSVRDRKRLALSTSAAPTSAPAVPAA